MIIRESFMSPVPLALVGGSGLLFALQGACLKVAVRDGISALEFVEVRGTMQLICTIMWLIFLRPMTINDWTGSTWLLRRWLVLRGCLGFCAMACSMAAVERLPLGDAAAIGFIQPAVSTLIACVAMKEMIDVVDGLCIMASMIGIILIARPSFLFGDEMEPLNPIGVALGLTGATISGVVVVLIRKLAQKLHFTVVLLYQAAGQVLLCPLVMPFFGIHWVLPTWVAMGAMVAGGLLGFMAQMMLTNGLAKEKVGKASALRSTGVLFSFILQLVVTPQEPVTFLSVLGAAIIILACAAMLIRAAHRKRANTNSSDSSQLDEAQSHAIKVTDECAPMNVELNDAAIAAREVMSSERN